MRRARPFLFVLVALCLHPACSHASDGPAIGVLLHRETEVVELGTSDEARLLVELKTGRRLLPAGTTKLTFRGDTAFVGKLGVRGEPFRLRAENRTPTRVARRWVEGWVEVLPEGKRWKVVNRLPLERYLMGVVAREVPEWFDSAAIETQAIASRTYATYQILIRPPHARHHVRATVSSQVYGGITSSEKVRAAVERTRGQVLLHDGKVFEAYFHSTCGGATAEGSETLGAVDIEPLRSVYCDYCQPSKFWRWKGTHIAEKTIRAAIAPLCQEHRIELGPIRRIEPIERGPGGHAAYLRVEHEGGSFEIDAVAFRLRIGPNRLRSTAFDCVREGDEFVFRGQGWGHGVGMCQFGVNGLAKAGYDAVAILGYYYRGSKVVEIWR